MAVVIGGVELRVFVNHTTEKTSVQRTVRDEADVQFLAKSQHTIFFDRAVHKVVLALDSRNRADFVRTANGVCIDFAHSPMQNFALLDQLAACFCYYFDRCVRVYAVLIEHAECFHTKIAQGIFAYTANVCRSAVFFGFHLHTIHELMSELR